MWISQGWWRKNKWVEPICNVLHSHSAFTIQLGPRVLTSSIIIVILFNEIQSLHAKQPYFFLLHRVCLCARITYHLWGIYAEEGACSGSLDEREFLGPCKGEFWWTVWRSTCGRSEASTQDFTCIPYSYNLFYNYIFCKLNLFLF